jgi:hypothetical protein
MLVPGFFILTISPSAQIVLWAELPGAEIRHLPGRMAIASPAELGRTARAFGNIECKLISIKSALLA